MTRRRRWIWALGLCALVVVAQPLLSSAQGVQGPTSTAFAQLDPSIRGRVCDLVGALQTTFSRSPVAARILASLSQSLGCAALATPGSTTTAFLPGLTTTPGVTLPTPPTTLPPCIPDNPSPTTVPCAPTTSTIFVPSTTSTTVTGSTPSTSSTSSTLPCLQSGMSTTTTIALCGGVTFPSPSTSTSIGIP